MAILDHVSIAVASERDATETCDALGPYLPEIERVTAVHVVEKGGGSIDKAPMEKRREDATEFLAVVDSELTDRVDVETRIEFGTDIVRTIVNTAVDADATAIAFRPRGGSRIVRMLSGDTATRLVTDPELPVIALPDPRGEDHG